MKENKIPKYAGPDTSTRTGKMSKEEIKKRFDNETAALYSQRNPAWLPEFEYAFSLIPQLVRPFVQGNHKALDLGAGTGNLSRTVLREINDVHVTLMDFSGNMLDEAPNVLAGFEGRYSLVRSDFMGRDLGQREYAAAISSFAVHHCRGEDEYLKLYKRIFDCLIHPGIFVCCDVVSGDNAFFIKRNEDEWAAFLAGADFPQKDIDRLLSNYHIEDSPLSVPGHLALLKQAGFTSADVIWKKANFAVYAGIIDGE
jgi:tRNA (cmo5U34)-methyltransferase